ncbi:MAG: PKD domain-containing protein [candidate division Zixibacteria bacterium]|nr:PKD domain-containing protein [candidate division Zixibacteria bacterium]
MTVPTGQVIYGQIVTRKGTPLTNPRKLLLSFALALCAVCLLIPGCDELVTETNYIEIAGHPTAEFGIDTLSVDSGCVPLEVHFIDLSNGPRDEWLWEFGDVGDDSTSTDTNPTHVYTSAGTYRVSLTIRDTETGGEDAEVKNRYIIVGTTVSDFSADTTVGCQGLAATFTPAEFGGVISWEWDFGDNSPVSDTSIPTHIYDSAGFYTVTLTAQGGCGEMIITKDSLIKIDNCPQVFFFADTTEGCTPLEVVFYDSSVVDSPAVLVSREWDFGDGQTSGDQNPTITFDSAGIYTVTLSVTTTDVTVTDSMPEYITVRGVPTAAFIADTPTEGCYSQYQHFQVRFLDQSTWATDSLVWRFGDGTLAYNDTSPVHAFVDPGIYTCSLEAHGPCGSDTVVVDSFIVLCDPLNADNTGFSLVPTTGDTTVVFTFSDTSTGMIFDRDWDFGDGSPHRDITVVTHKYDTAGTYEVILTLSNYCGEIEVKDMIEITE